MTRLPWLLQILLVLPGCEPDVVEPDDDDVAVDDDDIAVDDDDSADDDDDSADDDDDSADDDDDDDVTPPPLACEDPGPDRTVGLITCEEGANPGYTLVPPFESTTTWLIDPSGEVVNSWASDYVPAEARTSPTKATSSGWCTTATRPSRRGEAPGSSRSSTGTETWSGRTCTRPI